MASYGIKISRPTFDVKATLTEATKQNFVVLDASESLKLHHKGFVEATSYTHNLGLKPLFFCFKVDSVSAPTYFDADDVPSSSTTAITGITNPSYIVIFNEGEA